MPVVYICQPSSFILGGNYFPNLIWASIENVCFFLFSFWCHTKTPYAAISHICMYESWCICSVSFRFQALPASRVSTRLASTISCCSCLRMIACIFSLLCSKCYQFVVVVVAVVFHPSVWLMVWRCSPICHEQGDASLMEEAACWWHFKFVFRI